MLPGDDCIVDFNGIIRGYQEKNAHPFSSQAIRRESVSKGVGDRRSLPAGFMGFWQEIRRDAKNNKLTKRFRKPKI